MSARRCRVSAGDVCVRIVPNGFSQVDLVRRCGRARGCTRARSDKGANTHADGPAQRADDRTCRRSCRSATLGSIPGVRSTSGQKQRDRRGSKERCNAHLEPSIMLIEGCYSTLYGQLRHGELFDKVTPPRDGQRFGARCRRVGRGTLSCSVTTCADPRDHAPALSGILPASNCQGL
jgi:hypothetical protein